MNPNYIPAPLLEAIDGALLVMLSCMFFSAAFYTRESLSHDWRSRKLSPETKAAIALCTFVGSLTVRVGTHWWGRHLIDHGMHAPAYSVVAPVLIFISSVATVWGSICWMRTVLPIKYAAGAWLVISLAAVCFGIYMAA